MSTENKSIWYRDVHLDDVRTFAHGSMVEHLGIEYTEVGPDFLSGTMPVDHRTKQPYGILHGGATVTLAETLGSVAANLCVNQEEHVCVGLDISANHIRQVTQGSVTGTARPIHVGRKTHVWEIVVENEAGKTVSVSRLTIIVLARSNLS